MNKPNFKPKWRFSHVFCLFLLRGGVFGQTVAPYDILIDEFMADPMPTIDTLPNAEFIELYNRSDNPINLKGFKIVNGKDTSLIDTSYILGKQQYLIIYPKSKTEFRKFGAGYGVTKFGALNNTVDEFYLVSDNNKIIDAAKYDNTYYQDSKKSGGGWTLERINPNAPCDIRGWIASKNKVGGTPNMRNSVYIDSTDRIPPKLERYFWENTKTIVLVYDKSLNISIAKDISRYKISDNSNFESIELDTTFRNSQAIKLKFSQTLKAKTTYFLYINNINKDCIGRSLPLSKTDTIPLRLDESFIWNELIINEILADPETGGSRFIELYNNSKDKVVDIKNLKIDDIDVSTKMLLFPKQYIVLTDNPFYIQKRYKAEAFSKKIIKQKLTTWKTDTAKVRLRNGTTFLDSFTYNKSWHNPLIANTEGVSLERINPNKPSNDASNWQSAAQTVGYATPGRQNSQYKLTDSLSISAQSKQIFKLEKKTFSPDSDGFDDFLILNYRFDKSGYAASIFIFDDKGRRVKTLINNALLSVEGNIIWQGDTDEGLKVRQGIYIVSIEWVSPMGKVEREKLACYVAGRL